MASSTPCCSAFYSSAQPGLSRNTPITVLTTAPYLLRFMNLFVLWVISSFRGNLNETCSLLGFYADWNGNSVPTFRNNLSVPSSEVKQSRAFCLTLENGTDMLFHYRITILPCMKSKRSQISVLLYWISKVYLRIVTPYTSTLQVPSGLSP